MTKIKTKKKKKEKLCTNVHDWFIPFPFIYYLTLNFETINISVEQYK